MVLLMIRPARPSLAEVPLDDLSFNASDAPRRSLRLHLQCDVVAAMLRNDHAEFRPLVVPRRQNGLLRNLAEVILLAGALRPLLRLLTRHRSELV